MATPFAAIGYFPWCVADISAAMAADNYDYADNLTLATVMAFYWNLARIDMLTGGTITSYAGTVDEITLSAASNTIPSEQFAEPWTSGSENGSWSGFVTTRTFATFPSFTQPRERVCVGVATDPSADYFQRFDSAVTVVGQSFYFWVALGTDPGNAGKYRLYYNFYFSPCDGSAVSEPAIADFMNPAQNVNTVLTSGTNTIGGIAFNWISTCYDDTGFSSQSGLAMVLTMASFTY